MVDPGYFNDKLFAGVSHSAGVMKQRRDLLENLSSNTRSPELAEMARELLSGRLVPRQVVTSNIYSEALGQGIGQYVSWYDSLSQEEKESAAKEGQRYLDSLESVQRAEPSPRAGRRQRPFDSEEEPDYSETDWLAE